MPPIGSGDLIGYARVSTREQTLDLQVDALLKAGVNEKAIHVEKVSAVSQRRPALDLAIKHCRPGDVLVVWKLDRVARNVRHLYNFLDSLESKCVGFRCLTQPVDTTTAVGKLTFTLLGAIAEFERDLTVDRTRAGIARAKERGIKFGRRMVMTPDKAEVFEAKIAAGATMKEACAAADVKETTARKWYPGHRLDGLRKRGS